MRPSKKRLKLPRHRAARIAPRCSAAIFTTDLPAELIAQVPLAERRASRLLVLGRRGGLAGRSPVRRPAAAAAPGDLLVFNDTRVLPARVLGAQADRRPRRAAARARARRRAARSCICARATSRSRAARSSSPGGARARVVARARRARARSSSTATSCRILEAHGQTPLPPYIARAPERRRPRALPDGVRARAGRRRRADGGPAFRRCAARSARGARRRARLLDAARRRRHVRSRCAPSASRSTRCTRSGCEVAAETCAAVDALSQRAAAASSRSARRACARSRRRARGGKLAPFAGDSRLFIYPGFEFRVVDAMVTNFHLPESSLLMLVAAFAGREATLAAYRHAVARALPLLQLRRRDARDAATARRRDTHEIRAAASRTAARGAAASRSAAASSRRRRSCRSAPTARSRR